MTSVRAAKSKGSQFEMDCAYSLKKIYPEIRRPGPEGFQLQYDLKSDINRCVFECKRLKGISWNQLLNFFEKLKQTKPLNYVPVLCFQSNHQPCLVFDGVAIVTFESAYHVPFKKHTPIKRLKKVNHVVEEVRQLNKEDHVFKMFVT